MDAYRRLEDHHRQLFHLDHVSAITSWDEATMMPSGGGAARSDALATLAELRHERACAPELGALFDEAAGGQLDEWQRANLAHMRRAWLRNTALPVALVGARSRARSRCEQAWRTQRASGDWAGFQPLLEEVVKIEREVAGILGQAFQCAPYDALLDDYNPGLRQQHIDPVFEKLGAFLPDFIERAVQRSDARAVQAPSGPFPVAAQRALCTRLMGALGFDFERGRLDVSHHPFCGGVPRDVRITTRYDEGDYTTALLGLVHETGHGRYEQNLPEAWVEQPVGAAHGMAVHESQSLLFEMQVGRSQPFMRFAAPLIAEAMDPEGKQPAAFTPENLYAGQIRVTRSLIRVDADEATYPSHILLRYELEKELMSGALEVADIPARWDEGMQRYLGLDTRGNFRDGCMQDVHWPAGLFGYFPSYTLGAIIAAQLFAALRQAVPDVDEQIAAGDFAALSDWLRRAIWSQASRYDLDALLEHATGAPLSVDAYLAHLERRYLK
ncbi:carboxypeptidase M32 [Haliangium ochraceum]|nr:carboxypeptidase M32 [Haliangium ochraceum]